MSKQAKKPSKTPEPREFGERVLYHLASARAELTELKILIAHLILLAEGKNPSPKAIRKVMRRTDQTFGLLQRMFYGQALGLSKIETKTARRILGKAFYEGGGR
jgi:hypothetical protein